MKQQKPKRKIKKSDKLAPPLLDYIPEPPKGLRITGKNEWTRICTLLYDESLLTEWDLSLLHVMCIEYERYIDACKDIRKSGSYQKSRTGYEQQRPVVAERDKAFANYSKLLLSFGGNPASREKIKRCVSGEQKKNPYEEL